MPAAQAGIQESNAQHWKLGLFDHNSSADLPPYCTLRKTSLHLTIWKIVAQLAGYQAERSNHHYRATDSLSSTLGADMIAPAERLRRDIEAGIRKNHPL